MNDFRNAVNNAPTTPIASGSGGLDWLAIWRAMYDAEHAQTVATIGAQRARPTDRWFGRAGRFAQASGRAAQPDAFMRAVLPHLRPTDTLLEIGAGTGRHALFLASQVGQVVAVEPSESMRRHLGQRLEAANTGNVTVVQAAWPIAGLPPADIAISAHVVYGVREIGPFLSAMDAAARRACFVLLGFRQPSFVLAPFWEALYGVPRYPLPGALECFNVLHQLGIPAQVTLLPTPPYTFADRQEALEDLRWRLYLPEEATSDTRLLAAIDDLLVHDAAGRYAPPHQPAYTALLWWTRADHKQGEHGHLVARE
jgi:SAM-dependent methyltransferase